jgi:hypothetical protein
VKIAIVGGQIALSWLSKERVHTPANHSPSPPWISARRDWAA